MFAYGLLTEEGDELNRGWGHTVANGAKRGLDARRLAFVVGGATERTTWGRDVVVRGFRLLREGRREPLRVPYSTTT